ncbi:MAG TPA: YihY/virulence factor BrkB family protein [Stellaceae bacterium]|jgi:membrane protein|nr:YihY/virulence factor BrkB family protein [Stellaceae bacterium]
MPPALDAAAKRPAEPRWREHFAYVVLAAALFALTAPHPRSSARIVGHPTPQRPDRQPEVIAATAGPQSKIATARRVLADFSRHRVMTEAAAVTFYSILAIFPAVAALVSLYGLFADPATISIQLANMTRVLPGGAIDVVRDQMTRVAQQSQGKLGLGIVVGVIIALWSANGGTKSLFDALNIVYGTREERGFIKLNTISLGMTIGGIVFILIAATAVVVLPHALDFAGLSGLADTAIRILRWPTLLIVVAIGLALIYRFGPNRREARWRWITIGSAAAAVGWLIASFLFSWYAANFGSYNATYGSLGAIIGFMIWIWLSAIVVLAGAEIDATIETRRAAEPSVRRGP